MNRTDVNKLEAGDVIAIKGVPRILASKPDIDFRDSTKILGYVFNDVASETFSVAFKDVSLDVPKTDADAVRMNHLPAMATFTYPSNGTDPEIFVTDKAGVVIPAWKFLPSNEEAKKYNPGVHRSAFAYWDGFQAEISTPGGFSCHEGMTGAIANGVNAIHAAAIVYDRGAKLLAVDAVKVDKKDLLTAAENHVAFGCAPSENIYGIEKIDVGDPREVPYRFSGTHFHYQYVPKASCKWWPHGVVAMIDKIGGLVLTALGRGMEDPMRRKFYGRPGEFRSGKAGHIEYRTPGAFLMRSPSLYIFGADICRFGYKMGMTMDGRVFNTIPDVKDIILNCDADEAAKIIKKNETLFRNIFTRIYGNDAVVNPTMTILTNKKHFVAKQLKSIEESWGVGTGLPQGYRWRNAVTTL